LPGSAGVGPAAKAGWSLATRSYPPSPPINSIRTEKQRLTKSFGTPKATKEVLRRAAPGENPVAELEIDRPGDEASEPVSAIAARMDPKGRRELEAAGVIDSRFGPVTLLRLADNANDAASRLGFIKHLDEPNPRISGWSCQGSDMPARRALKRPRRGL
jgi:hypothetical protein